VSSFLIHALRRVDVNGCVFHVERAVIASLYFGTGPAATIHLPRYPHSLKFSQLCNFFGVYTSVINSNSLRLITADIYYRSHSIWHAITFNISLNLRLMKSAVWTINSCGLTDIIACIRYIRGGLDG